MLALAVKPSAICCFPTLILVESFSPLSLTAVAISTRSLLSLVRYTVAITTRAIVLIKRNHEITYNKGARVRTHRY